MCRGQRTTSRVSPCLPEALVTLSLVTVYVRSAGIGPAMDSLFSIPSSHRSAEIQIDVGVLGIQTSSHIFVASALPIEPHGQPHKVCCLCKWESTNREDRERTERGGDTGCVQRTLDREAKSNSEAMYSRTRNKGKTTFHIYHRALHGAFSQMGLVRDFNNKLCLVVRLRKWTFNFLNFPTKWIWFFPGEGMRLPQTKTTPFPI